MKRAIRFLGPISTAIVALFVACGDDGGGGSPDGGGDDGGGDDGGAVEVSLTGAVEKGPFIVGTTVEVSPVDSEGNPTGLVFSTTLTNDLGNFDLEVAFRGPALLEGDGFYFNEALGRLSTARLTLHAFCEVGASGTQAAHINLVTHLTNERIKELMGDGMDLPTAAAQAETELLAALGVGPAGIDPGKPGIDMHLLGGDDVGNAYLMALGAVFVQAAVDQVGATGPIDATLQEFLNACALDFSDDGRLSTARTEAIAAAESHVFGFWVEELLARRLAEVESSAVVPDVDRALDVDGDGFANASDNCPLVANPGQDARPGRLCDYEVSIFPLGGGSLDPQQSVFADFDGDGAKDVLSIPRSGAARMLPGLAGGGFGTAREATVAGLTGGGDGARYEAADVNGDGRVDLVRYGMDPMGGDGGLFAYPQNGTGNFDAAADLWPAGLPASIGECYLMRPGNWARFADLSGDGRADMVWDSGGCVVVMLQAAGGGFANPTLLVDRAGGSSPAEFADVNGDGNPDIVALVDETSHRRLVTFLGNGTGAFTAGPGLDLGATASSSGGWPPLPGDFDGDDDLDLVVSARPDSTSFLLAVNDGTGTFSLASTTIEEMPRLALDLDGDGADEFLGLPAEGAGPWSVAIVRIGGASGPGAAEPVAFAPPGLSWSLEAVAGGASAGPACASGSYSFVPGGSATAESGIAVFCAR